MCSCWSPPEAIYYMSQFRTLSPRVLWSAVVATKGPYNTFKRDSSPVVSHSTSSNPITRELQILRRGRERDFVHARESASFWRENRLTVFIVLRVLAGCRSGGNKLSNVRIVQMAYCRNPFYLPKSGRESQKLVSQMSLENPEQSKNSFFIYFPLFSLTMFPKSALITHRAHLTSLSCLTKRVGEWGDSRLQSFSDYP